MIMKKRIEVTKEHIGKKVINLVDNDFEHIDTQEGLLLSIKDKTEDAIVEINGQSYLCQLKNLSLVV